MRGGGLPAIGSRERPFTPESAQPVETRYLQTPHRNRTCRWRGDDGILNFSQKLTEKSMPRGVVYSRCSQRLGRLAHWILLSFAVHCCGGRGRLLYHSFGQHDARRSDGLLSIEAKPALLPDRPARNVRQIDPALKALP